MVRHAGFGKAAELSFAAAHCAELRSYRRGWMALHHVRITSECNSTWPAFFLSFGSDMLSFLTDCAVTCYIKNRCSHIRPKFFCGGHDHGLVFTKQYSMTMTMAVTTSMTGTSIVPALKSTRLTRFVYAMASQSFLS